MSKIIEIAVLALGGVSLFAVAFLGFAALSGAPLSQVPVVGEWIHAPPSATAEVVSEVVPVDPHESPARVIESSAGMLQAYAFDPPFSADELQALAAELQDAKRSYEELSRAVRTREAELVEREELVQHQQQSLVELRAELERLKNEVAQKKPREPEPAEDESAAAEPEKTVNWQSVAKLFAKGDEDELVQRLMVYEPEDAARILAALDPARVAALLNALPRERWKEYVDAYSAASGAP